MTTFPDGVYAYGGMPLTPGGVQGLSLGRGFGRLDAWQDGRTKVVYVDKDVDITRKGYSNGYGDSWANAQALLQTGLNYGRRNYGTSDVSYDDEQDIWIIVAPGDYSSEGRIAFSTGGSFHIIGLGNRGLSAGGDSGVFIAPSSPTTFAFGGGGTGLELANVTIKLTANSTAAFYWTNLENAWIHDNVFLCEGKTSSIGMDIYQAKGTLIERNLISAPTTAGLDFNYSSQTYEYVWNTVVRENYFMAGGTCTDAIKVNANLVGPAFFIRNYIAGATWTETIDCAGTSAGQYVSIQNFLVGTTSAAQGTTIRGDVSS